jgi:phage terminase large subunit GpA-like protein
VGVEEIVVIKGAQVGWSELTRNVMGYWIDCAPDPLLILMPDQNSTDAFREERIEPMLRNTPALARHVSPRAWDSKKYKVKLSGMWMFLAWAGSKTGTKSRPIRYLVCEEPDEYPPFSSTGGDPLSKAMKRLTTYQHTGQSRLLLGGTPTTRTGNTWKRWEMCAARYHMWVPCPHCNGYQLFTWKGVKWPELKDEPERAKRAEKIDGGNLAYYECEHCKKAILDHHKIRMLRRGIWATEDQAVTADGRVVGPTPKAKRIGFKISGLYSPWLRFSQLAREWVEAQGDPDALCDFINQRLAEPFEEQRAKIEPSIIANKAKGAPAPMEVPGWARALIATADTQGTDEKDGYFWYVIRAWGYGYRSQLVDFGVCSSKEELRQRCLERPIPIQGQDRAVTPQMLLVDSGGPRWNEVYEFSQSDERIHPAKGLGLRRTWMVEERPQKNHKVVLWEIDVEQSQDLLHRLIIDPDVTKHMPHNAINDDYCRQMCSKAKIYDPNRKREAWVEVVKNNDHIWDCEAMQCAVAWRVGCGTPEPTDTPAAKAIPSVDYSKPRQW